MLYQFSFHSYQRRFRYPLSTSHGVWDVREGIIIQLVDETGQIGWGEIAPIPWFGSESLQQALNFCQQLPPKIATRDIFTIPSQLPACQFGFESAREWGLANWKLGDRGASLMDLSVSSFQSLSAFSYLLPTGKAALPAWQTPWQQGTRTFKWKIGVAPIEEELKVFDELMQALPSSVQLRLDANGGLTQKEAHQWLGVADAAGIVEFLEQPLTPEQFDAMLEMSRQYSTSIALDESVATLDQLEDCYQKGWRGVFVIKAAIAGSPKRLRQFCKEHSIDAVFSSVFETAIARKAALQLAAELSHPNRAVGFGINQWFQQDEPWVVDWIQS
ncbi:MAG TPA: o-succinylbenzoate synthase [Cyanophyceae cyanobacterium]